MAEEKKPTQTEILKEYLLEKDNAYLLDENNNGKTIMLSGAWGSGKTHFWQETIEPDLKTKLEDKACLYVSLYGKDNLDSLKKEILINASSVDNLLSKEVASFGFDVLSSIKDSDLKIGQLFKAFSEATDSGKSSKGLEQLKDGGIICFDDFERKSEKINLNDLFGFISQLAIELNCKIIIILNSNVFTGKEAEIFSNVKEKTISKFFYFNPSSEELFESISDNPKYNALNEYKTDILSAIKETKELNARIYVQVLDNCLEWLEYKENPYKLNIIKHDQNIKYKLRTLTLNSICFIKNHFILTYPDESTIREANTNYKENYIKYNEINYSRVITKFFNTRFTYKDLNSEIIINKKISTFFNDLNEHITGVKSNDQRISLTPEMRSILLEEINRDKNRIVNILKFGYKLFVAKKINKKSYIEINNFIKTGILLP